MSATVTTFAISANANFRREVAEAVVKESHPGYSVTYQGGYYADPVEGRVYFRESQAAWNPWSDEADARVVGVEQLVDGGCDYSDYVDWSDEVSNLSSLTDMIDGYLESEGEEREPNGDTPDWVDYSEVIAWAVEQPQFAAEIQQYESEAHERAVDLAELAILDSVEVEA